MNTKKVLIISGVAVAVIGAGVGSYFLFFKDKDKTTDSSGSSSTSADVIKGGVSDDVINQGKEFLKKYTEGGTGKMTQTSANALASLIPIFEEKRKLAKTDAQIDAMSNIIDSFKQKLLEGGYTYQNGKATKSVSSFLGN